MLPADIIPQPGSFQPGPGAFTLDSDLTLAVDPSAALAVEALQRFLGHTPPVSNLDAGGAIRIAVHPDPQRPSGYRLKVTPDSIEIVGADPAGAFYGVQTLRQMLPPDEPVPIGSSVPAGVIDDEPSMRWRGLMVDVSRHFFGVEFILRLIDLMALHKLNVLHLHLTDDQGWRVEVPDYPRLTEIGAWRAETVIGNDHGIGPVVGYDGLRHGGYYTHEELRQIIEYAAERYIQVVPEIDMPGHIQSAIAAYPDLGLAAEPVEVRRRWGISDHILRLDDSSLDFCRSVWSEILDVFPSEFVHIGGDEVPTHRWRSSPEVRKRIHELALPNARALQGWFTREMATYVGTRGRRLVGWDEVLDAGDVADNVVVMAWRDASQGVRAASLGLEVVMAPRMQTYLDSYQTDNVNAEPLSFPRLVTLETVHNYRPLPAAIASDATSSLILGAQAQLWTAYTPTKEQAEYMLFPRLSAFAEAVWRQPHARTDFADFLRRLGWMLARLDALGVSHRSPRQDDFDREYQNTELRAEPAASDGG